MTAVLEQARDPLTKGIPGERESGMLTTFGGLSSSMRANPLGPTTMEAATIAERQREGGGALRERRSAPHGSTWTRLTSWLSLRRG